MPGMTPSARLPDRPGVTAGVTVLWVPDGRPRLERVRSTLEAEDAFEVGTAADPAGALRRLDGVDCVVVDGRASEVDGLELLADVRERDSGLPLFLLGGDSPPDVADAVLSEPWTDYLRRESVATDADRLSHRIRRLVGHRRSEALARRALAGVETARDGVAVVAPDGTFEFVGRAYAARFGHDPDELVGRPWREVYPAPEVERLESTALPVAGGGWRWSGRCVGFREDGGTFTARTTVAALDDGSFVFVLPGGNGEGD